MGDLFGIGYHPYLVGGDPIGFINALETISAFAPKLLVPGHGPVGVANSLTVMGQYIQTLDEIARKMVEEGIAEETIDTMTIPEPYDAWLFASFFSDNLHFLYQRWLGEQGEAAGSIAQSFE